MLQFASWPPVPPTLFIIYLQRAKVRRKMSDGKCSGRKKRRREGDGFEDAVKYWASARVKNNGKFALSYLDEQVLSWSLRDIFNRDLLRNKVPISWLPCTVATFIFLYLWTLVLCCRDSYPCMDNELAEQSTEQPCVSVATSNRLLKRTKTVNIQSLGIRVVLLIQIHRIKIQKPRFVLYAILYCSIFSLPFCWWAVWVWAGTTILHPCCVAYIKQFKYWLAALLRKISNLTCKTKQ